MTSLRAEDESGSFGILDGHADLLTGTDCFSRFVATVPTAGSGYCAVRRGVLSVRGGKQIAIATREAQRRRDLDALEASVLAQFRAMRRPNAADASRRLRLHTQAIRRIVERCAPTAGWSSARDVDEPNGLLRSVRRRRDRHQNWLRQGEPSFARYLAQVGALGWTDRGAHAARGVPGTVDRSPSRHGHLLDRPAVAGWPRARLLVRLAMDARTMMIDAVLLAAGLAGRHGPFRACCGGTQRSTHGPAGCGSVLVLQVARLAGWPACSPSPRCTVRLPLLLTALGVLIARPS